ncbi:MAG TPA: tetratricopeptide repeat protein [Candidatus Polarisedimenticolaceae bacterium]|nr:tetratricopeptide repeat protein [Candidatus Polarisedimenticolaceae bacterium]
MHRTVTALLLSLLVPAAALAQRQVRPEHDRLGFGVVETVPGMDEVAVKTMVYKTVTDRALEMDVYAPPGGGAAPKSAVVFVNGVGDFPGQRKLRHWGQYTTWPRLIAASGMVAITFDARGQEDNVSDVGDAFAYLRAHGRELGIDPARMAAWACSANVRSALTVLMQPGPVPAVAAVLYYGNGDPAELRGDLPVLLARAGKDRPQMNAMVDQLAARAVQANAPWTILNVPNGHHAFDVLDETEESRAAIRATVAFLRAQLEPAPAPQRPVHAGRAAAAHVMAGEWAEAEAAYARFVERDPTDVDALLYMASAQIELKKTAEAAANLRKVTAVDPSNAEAWSMLGRTEAEAKNAAAAVEALNRAIALRPDDGEAHHQLGKVRLAQQDATGAVAELERAVELNPGNGWAWHNLALAYMAAKQPGKAAVSFEKVLPFAPQNPALLYNTACAYALSGDPGRAFELLDRAVTAGYKDKPGLLADPDLGSLRGDPRFAEIVKRLG